MKVKSLFLAILVATVWGCGEPDNTVVDDFGRSVVERNCANLCDFDPGQIGPNGENADPCYTNCMATCFSGRGEVTDECPLENPFDEN